RMVAAFRTTQAARYSLHESARDWFAEKWPGFFASRGEAQPLIDMLLTDKVDPQTVDRDLDDALRALGLSIHNVYVETSKDMPKFVFTRTDKMMTPGIKSSRTYAMWAQRDAAVAATRLDGYGSDPNRSLASRYSNEIEGVLTTLSISSLLSVLEADFARLRDTARASHRRFRVSTMERLRETFLTLSLDVTSVDRDLRHVWDRGPRPVEEAIFTMGWTHQFKQRARAERWRKLPTGTVNEWAREDQRAELGRLCSMDRDYRDVLSTAASLGASAHASRSGRIALLVAVASLAVAAATLVVTVLLSNAAK
ncbi:MAG TPA: hypothetical protein VJ777_01890, partial [Mycobacterium sp.]|nr:hypothetical protein [Mycobacterium sp.]